MTEEQLNENDNIAEMLTQLDVRDEGEVLHYAQSKRYELSEAFLKSAKSGDTKSGNLVRALISDMDKQIFTGRKLKVEDKNADSNALLASSAAKIMDSHGIKVSRHDTAPDDTNTDGPNFDVSEMPTVDIPEELYGTDSSEVDIQAIIDKGLSVTSGISQEDED